SSRTAWLPPVAPRAYASIVHLSSEDPAHPTATAEAAVRLPLPGGWVTTAWGEELHRVTASAAALAGPSGCRVPA
ncbi:MAG: hypothetical protein ACXVX0_18770, partial [Blastococcus sp.]